MKNTVAMILAILVAIATWFVLSLLIWVASPDMTYREVLGSVPVLFIMGMFGWMPSAIVAEDYSKL